MPSKRRPLSKKLRFQVLNRDDFTCRYCGVRAEAAQLAIDHILPVSRGGSDDEVNLVTSCVPCNQGKSNRLLLAPLPMSEKAAELQKRMEDQRKAAKAFRALQRQKKRDRQDLVDYLCRELGQTHVSRCNVSSLFNLFDQFGPETVYDWISIAVSRVGANEKKMMMYVFGIRRNVLKEMEGDS